MKRLNLDETWRLCLSMWRWIAKKKRNGDRREIEALKGMWVFANEYGINDIKRNCFFCEYVSARDDDCKLCPALKIDKGFHCNRLKYSFYRHPVAFYNKLVSLNRKRLKKKAK